MKVAVVCMFPAGNAKNDMLVRALCNAAESKCHQVSLLYALKDTLHLMIYDYLVVVAPASGFLGNEIACDVASLLLRDGSFAGKKGCAALIKKGLGAQKACQHLMESMENCGITVDDFAVIRSDADAQTMGKRI